MGFIIIAIHSRVRGNKKRGANISNSYSERYLVIDNYYSDVRSLYFCFGHIDVLF